MLKILKTITSIIKDSVEIFAKVKGHSDERKKRHLAQTLNLVYSRLNECIVTGEQIIDSLQRFLLDTRQVSYYTKSVY